MFVVRRLLIATAVLAGCALAGCTTGSVPHPASRPGEPPPAPPDEAGEEPAPPAVAEARRIEEEIERVELEPPPAEVGPRAGAVIELYFEAGSAVLSEEARSTLDALAARLPGEGGEDCYLELQGHADPSGGEEANRRLARRRAEEARRYLHQKGVPLDCMGVVALGSSAPAADNRTPEGRERNRRVVVVLVGAPPAPESR